ncbi:MAG: DUF6702 family protein, partial [Bacteroidota bacterium]
MKNRRLKYFYFLIGSFGLFFISQSFLPKHAFYVSIHDIRFDQEWGKFDIKIKIFTNDLEDALIKYGHARFFLNTQQEMQGADLAITRYIQEKVKLNIGKKDLYLNFNKKEYLEDASWIYLEAEAGCQPRAFNISSKILLELFADQTNIIR